MFKSFFKKDDEDIFETVDPIVEQRRNEKFSKPLIYDEEFEEKKEKPKPKKETPKTEIKPKQVDIEVEKKAYEMMEVISPMFGLAEEKATQNKKQSTKKKTVKKTKKRDNSLIQVISPFYGNFDQENEDEEDTNNDAVLTSAQEETVEEDDKHESSEEIMTVEDNLRNIAKIVEEEQDQLKIIEERTGEFKLDFGTNSTEKQGSLIDEIDDNMSLDELMSLYEKKFKD